jgi:hypothetical protein
VTRNLSGERGIKSITVSHKSGLPEGNIAQVVSRNHMGKNVIKADVVIEERICEIAFVGVTTKSRARKHASKAQGNGRGPPTTSVS